MLIFGPSNGKDGHIQYRNFSIDHLIQNHDYEEVIYLLLWGNLPSTDDKLTFRRALATEMTKIPQSVMEVIGAFP